MKKIAMLTVITMLCFPLLWLTVSLYPDQTDSRMSEFSTGFHLV